MDSSIVLSVVAAIITLIATGLFLYQSRPKKTAKPTQEETQEQPHKYLTPAALSGNAEWQTLLEDWQSLSTLSVFTPEYSRAEEAYRLKLREFLLKELNKSNILEVPVVALALQCTEIYIDRYHTRIGDLDYRKALIDRTQVTHLIHSGNLSEDIVSVVKKIRDPEDLVTGDSVDAAMDHFRKIKSELLNETSHEHL